MSLFAVLFFLLVGPIRIAEGFRGTKIRLGLIRVGSGTRPVFGGGARALYSSDVSQDEQQRHHPTKVPHLPAVHPHVGFVPPIPAPKKMDDRLFTLNKKIIDTVYDIICFVYRDKDYPRFFVLETVARVPYFAYLSVLHLREVRRG